MFLISFIFCKSKSASPGVFYLTLSEKCVSEEGLSVWNRNNVSTGIKSTDGVLTDEMRLELNHKVRLLYCIIEKFDASGKAYERQDIIAQFKLALQNDASMQDVIKRSQKKFPLRSDLVRLGTELKRDFQMVYAFRPETAFESNTLNGFLLQKGIDFKNEGKGSTSNSYINTAASLRKYTKSKPVLLAKINREFVEGYSDWLKATGVSDSTQSFYLRTFRSALNYAKEEMGIAIHDNLFDGLNTKIYKASTSKGTPALTRELLGKISTLDLKENVETETVRDMFMFAFYCHGLELSDVLNLKKENLSNGKLTFCRRKKGKTIEIQLDKTALRLIEKYKDTSKEFLFPLMETYRGFLYHSICERVRKSLCKIKNLTGCNSLSFNSNITAWQHIVSQLDLSAVLLGRLG